MASPRHYTSDALITSKLDSHPPESDKDPAQIQNMPPAFIHILIVAIETKRTESVASIHYFKVSIVFHLLMSQNSLTVRELRSQMFSTSKVSR